MVTTDVVEISGFGSMEIKLPADYTDFTYAIVSGPDIPLPASNAQDENAEYIKLRISNRRSTRFPFRSATVAVVTYMLFEPRVIEYTIV